MIVLDTHVLLWVAAKSDRLGQRAARRIDRALHDDELALSAFSFWEVATLLDRGRLRLRGGAEGLRAGMLRMGVRELPVDGEIAILAANLRSFHGDPADRIIGATALAHRATLITADEALLRWQHGPPLVDATK